MNQQLRLCLCRLHPKGHLPGQPQPPVVRLLQAHSETKGEHLFTGPAEPASEIPSYVEAVPIFVPN